MGGDEYGVVFPCQGESLVGILSPAAGPKAWGVVVVVGGPQYRGGSHRQFVLLARALAAAGYPSLRFDCRGMGDSTGLSRDFRDSGDDIGAAVAALQAHCPSVEKVVLWGLCDAASAALLYCRRTRDPRIGGLCLLNPWVRSEITQAKTQIKHYYVRRLLSRQFWRKLAAGGVHLPSVMKEVVQKLRVAFRSPAGMGGGEMSFQDAMAHAWREFPGAILLLLSGRDDTAREFEENSAAGAAWAGLLEAPRVQRLDLAESDHTFSSRIHREAAERACVAWLESLGETSRPVG